MDKYDRKTARHRNRKRMKRLLWALCMMSLILGFIMGIVFFMAVTGM